MKKLFAPAFAVISIHAIGQNLQPITIGTPLPMPDAKMKSVSGKEYSIKDVAKKNGVLVMFSCNTCPVVKKYQGRTLESIKAAEENGFGVIIINSNEATRSKEDSYNAMQHYAKAQSYQNVPYVVDNNSALANAFGATKTPECFLFNAKNELVYHGAIDDNQEAAEAARNHLAVALNEVKTGKQVSVKESRSVGCTIKRVQ